MSRLQDIPPDLRAVLSLLLGQRKDYAALAGMLAIEQRAVHDRAHAGLALLAPQQARALTPAQREEVGEYLLGQADPAQRAAALALLQSSPPAQAWAQALSVELAPLAAQPLPEIPAAASPETPPTSTAPPAAPSSRRGGAILLGGLAVVAIAAVALIVGLSGGGGSTPGATNTSTNSATETSTGTTDTTGSSTSDSSTTPSSGKAGSSGSSNSSGGSGTTTGETHVEATLPLTPPDPSSKALGIVEVASRGSAHAFLIAAEHLPPTNGFRYAAWLYNPASSESLLLGQGPTVGSNGKLTAAGGLPENAARYSKIILTEEHSQKPTQPGTIVLSGTFKL
jgi:hypothetical protein